MSDFYTFVSNNPFVTVFLTMIIGNTLVCVVKAFKGQNDEKED